MDEEIKDLLIDLVDRLDTLEDSVTDIRDKKATILTDEEKKIEEEEEIISTFNKEELVEKIENLLISLDDLIGFVEDNMEIGMLNMPIMMIRMLLNFVLSSSSSIVDILPSDICTNVVGKTSDVRERSRPRKDKKGGISKLCSLADLVGNFFPR